MGLEAYREKRDFRKTGEPGGGKTGKKAGKRKLRFVVQRHHASRLHYDFRLEMEGVLKSWAVPKGPSLNPADKRLAIMVEDHPYEYRSFEGVIPEGSYGAGVVSIFDQGTYDSLNGEQELVEELKKGSLKFRLHGKILKGEFALVKLKNRKDNSWLLIKHRDGYATDKKFDSEDLVPETVKQQGLEQKKKTRDTPRKKTREPRPEEVLDGEAEKISRKKARSIPYKPMLARLSEKVFDHADWIYEKKLDGYRAMAYTGKTVRLISRNGIDFTGKYKTVSDALQGAGHEAVIDGELVAEDKKGRGYFQEMQNYDPADKKFTLKYYVFDLLGLDGYDIRWLELVKRKELLEMLVKQIDHPSIVYNGHVKGKGKKLFAEAGKKEWEGIIAKDGNSRYQSGERSGSWKKFKHQRTQEAVIIGFTRPSGSRKYFGSLGLCIYENKELVYIGNCGTGYNDKTLKEIHQKLSKLKTRTKPVSEKVHQEKNMTWVRPELVCEVTYSEWTEGGRLRHPVFKGLRIDKETKQVVQEVPATEQEEPDEKEEHFGRIKVKLTNQHKLYWKKEGITKGRLVQYYRDISDYILPYLKDRPLTLNRHPDGADAPGFFQKDLDMKQVPSWIKTARIFSESNNKEIDYLVCPNKASLLWMVNLGCIEINPWLSTYKKQEHPLFAVMDIDPRQIAFEEAVHVALTAEKLLKKTGIRPYIKTSGSKGLHIFIYLGARYEYEAARNFIRLLGQLIHEQHPQTTSLERSPSKRKRKIYLDYLQNSRGQTIAAPYSARPRPGAPVSTPLYWKEVNENLDIKAYTIFNTLERLRKKGDPWKDIFKQKADLKAALKHL